MLIGSAQSLIIASADTQTNGQIVNANGVVTTNKLTNIYALRNNKLVKVTNRALISDSAWVFNKTLSGDDGLTYYHVATNEWLPSNAIKSTSNNNQASTPREKTSVTIGKWASATVNSNGDRTGNILPTSSSWQAFAEASYINGKKFYQISSNEFVSTEDLASSQPIYVAPAYTPNTTHQQRSNCWK
ncbi:SLAP domain-containing protein [Companilactobacillus jidongensis]|uniref:SLAP domain-containing protein n=1 Tax=Companilactobacillus jidongensis TaxID=2486006 RepID=UPI000F7AABD1|nr:SLAP domain-containing protein [Companilactobacillus jidongensis]